MIKGLRGFFKVMFGLPCLYMALSFLNLGSLPFLQGNKTLFSPASLTVMTFVIFFTWRYWVKLLKPLAVLSALAGVGTYFASTFMNAKMHHPLTMTEMTTLFGALLGLGVALALLRNSLKKENSVWSKIPGLKTIASWMQSRVTSSECPTNLTLAEIDRFGEGNSQMKGRIFEEYIAQLYQHLGYNAETTTALRRRGALPESIMKTGGSGEQGVDVMVEIMSPNGNKNYMAVQCKHYSNTVGNKAVQEIVTALKMYGATKGVVVTNNYFTKQAKDLAQVNGVTLIDRDALAKMISDANNYYAINNQKKSEAA